VGLRVGADGVPVHPAVQLRVVVRYQRWVEVPGAEVLPAAGKPGDGRVRRAVDRALDELAGRHIQYPDRGLLVASGGGKVRQPVALLGRYPAVQRGGAVRVDRHRVHQHALGTVGLDREQHAVLLAWLTPYQEMTVAAPHRDADLADGEQLR